MEILAALLGAVVGGILTGVSSWLTLRWQLNAENLSRSKEQEERVKALLSALYHEISSVWNMYMSGAGKSMDELKSGRGFNVIVPNPGEYFPVYVGNVTNLGQIPNTMLREQLMNTYTIARALMDGYKLNNQLLSELHAIRGQRPSFSSITEHLISNNSDVRPLVEFGAILKIQHDKCKVAVDELLPQLKLAASTA